MTYDDVIEQFEDVLSETNLKYDIENTGIGAYEYWGSKEVDHGKNFMIFEDSEIEVETDLDSETLEQYGKDIIDVDEIFTGHTIRNFEEIEVYGKVDDYAVDGNKIIFYIKWDDTEI